MHFVPGRTGRAPDHAVSDGGDDRGRRGGGGGRDGESLPEDAIEEIRRYYGFDKPVHIRYAQWLWNVAAPRSRQLVHLPGSGLGRHQVAVSRLDLPRTHRISSELSRLRAARRAQGRPARLAASISSAASSCFSATRCPGWALGTALLVLFGGGSFWNVFPLGGFRPDNWEYLSFGEKIIAQLHHMFLPVLCYMVGSFATLTILTKNSLMENLGQDYVRTAFAKGLHERRVIFVHALRNSLIPLATGLGHVFSLVLAGSFLIERVFNIDGMGYLGYTSILQRDYPVALGILVIGSLLMLVGNILSDIIYAFVDPRIRFK